MATFRPGQRVKCIPEGWEGIFLRYEFIPKGSLSIADGVLGRTRMDLDCIVQYDGHDKENMETSSALVPLRPDGYATTTWDKCAWQPKTEHAEEIA